MTILITYLAVKLYMTKTGATAWRFKHKKTEMFFALCTVLAANLPSFVLSR